MKTHNRVIDGIVLLGCACALGLTVLYPVGRLFVSVLTDWPGQTLLEGPRGVALFNTLWMALATVATAGILGTGLAFLFETYAFPGKRTLAALAYLPFTLPPLVGVIAFYYLVGRDGFLPRLMTEMFGVTSLSLDGPTAILVIHTYSFCVFYYATVGPALRSRDVALVEAARSLGASRWYTFAHVTLPLLRPALAGASLLTFMSATASFSAPLIFGDRFPMLSVQIYQERNQGNDAMAAALSLTLAAMALLGLLLFRAGTPARGTASKGAQHPPRSGAGRFSMTLAAWFTIGVLLLPHLTVAYLSFVDHRAWHTEIIPRTLTLANYAGLLSDENAFAPIRNSLWMSAIATLLTLAVGIPAAYLIARRKPGGRLLNLAVMTPWALPGTVIAVSLITTFNDPRISLYATAWLLPLAYFVRAIPLMTRMAAATIGPFDATLIEAGRSLGASPAYCLRHIAVPLIAPAIAAAAALVFTMSLGEFVASILLYSPNSVPIAVKINMVWRGSGIGSAFAYGMVLMVLVGAAFALTRRGETSDVQRI